jgi:hypothetical protein
MAKEAGIKYPVALTSNLYHQYVNPEPMPEGQDKEGRLWDVLWMFTVAARKARDSFIKFHVIFDGKEVELWAVCEAQSPSDPSPAINIMLPEDD